MDNSCTPSCLLSYHTKTPLTCHHYEWLYLLEELINVAYETVSGVEAPLGFLLNPGLLFRLNLHMTALISKKVGDGFYPSSSGQIRRFWSSFNMIFPIGSKIAYFVTFFHHHSSSRAFCSIGYKTHSLKAGIEIYQDVTRTTEIDVCRMKY